MLQAADNEFLQTATKIVEENLDEADFHVHDLAAALQINRSTLYLKLKSLVDQTPQTFIRTLRLQYSARLLHEDNASIGDIAAKVGFLEPTHFSRSFKLHFGLSPSEYRQSTSGESE